MFTCKAVVQVKQLQSRRWGLSDGGRKHGRLEWW